MKVENFLGTILSLDAVVTDATSWSLVHDDGEWRDASLKNRSDSSR